MALNWMGVEDPVFGTRLQHASFAGGHSSHVAVSTERRVAVCVLTIFGRGPAREIGERWIDEVVRRARDGESSASGTGVAGAVDVRRGE